ncbi:MAG: hypothetical protein ABI356_06430 [Steroidobacteraceae bacterium]
MSTTPTEPRSIGGVLDDGLRLWLGSIAKTWPLALLAQLMVAIPLLILGYKFQGAVPTVPGMPTRPMSAASAQAMLNLFKSPATWLTYLGILVFFSLVYTAVVLRIAAVASGAVSSLGGALSSALRLLPRLLAQFLLFMVAALVVGVALALLSAAGSLALGLVSIILFFVLIFVLGRVFFASIVLMLDDAGPAESIAISWRLTRGYWWRCAGILLVLFIIGSVFSLVVGFISAVLGGAMGAASFLAIGVSQLISLVVNSVLGSLYPAVLVAILYDLKLRTQGGDLLSRVDALARQ